MKKQNDSSKELEGDAILTTQKLIVLSSQNGLLRKEIEAYLPYFEPQGKGGSGVVWARSQAAIAQARLWIS